MTEEKVDLGQEAEAAEAPEEPTPEEPTEGAEPSEVQREKQSAEESANYQKRIDELVRQRWEERRAREEAERRLAEAQKGAESGNETDIEKLAAARAEQIVAEREYHNRVQATRDRGLSDEATKGTYAQAVSNLDSTFGLDQFSAPGGFVDLVTSDPNGHKILAHLGNNLGEAERILSLPATQQAREIGRLSVTLEKPAQKPSQRLSSAPPPADPVRGSSGAGSVQGPNANGEFASQEEFRRWREAQRG